LFWLTEIIINQLNIRYKLGTIKILDFFFKAAFSPSENINIVKYSDNKWASDPHIRVISEGSCDTEDWSDAALITGIK